MFSTINSLFTPYSKKLREAIDEVPSRQYYMGLSLVTLVLIKFFFVPKFEQLTVKQEQLQQMADSVKSPELMLTQTQLMQEALSDKQQLHEQWVDSFYQGSISQVKVDVVNKLQASARARGLLYLRSRWLRTPAERLKQFSTVEPLIYSVLIRGDYNEIRQLVQEWQTLKPFIRIEEMKLENRRGVGVVAVTFKIAIFRINQTESDINGNS